MEHIAAKLVVSVEPDDLWAEVGSFQGVGRWHPWLESVRGDGETPGSIRIASTGDGEPQVERLLAISPDEHFYRYRIESTPLPVSDYVGEFRIRPIRSGASEVEWSTTFELTSPDADPEAIVGDFLRIGLQTIAQAHRSN